MDTISAVGDFWRAEKCEKILLGCDCTEASRMEELGRRRKKKGEVYGQVRIKRTVKANVNQR